MFRKMGSLSVQAKKVMYEEGKGKSSLVISVPTEAAVIVCSVLALLFGAAAKQSSIFLGPFAVKSVQISAKCVRSAKSLTNC